MKAGSSPRIFEQAISTPEGMFMARYSENGLCELRFPLTRQREIETPAAAHLPSQVQLWHAQTSRALQAALAGRAPGGLPPLDLSAGTEFQQRVWATLRQIACGHTWSYGQVARAIGSPKAVRAVGGACGANPVPVLIPCHRVLAARGQIGGFSGGLDWKRKLLAREGILLDV